MNFIKSTTMVLLVIIGVVLLVWGAWNFVQNIFTVFMILQQGGIGGLVAGLALPYLFINTIAFLSGAMILHFASGLKNNNTRRTKVLAILSICILPVPGILTLQTFYPVDEITAFFATLAIVVVALMSFISFKAIKKTKTG